MGQEGEEKEQFRPLRRRRWWWPRHRRECALTRPWPIMTEPPHRLLGGSVVLLCFNKCRVLCWAAPSSDCPGSRADIHIIVVLTGVLGNLLLRWQNSPLRIDPRGRRYWAHGNPKIGARNHEPRSLPRERCIGPVAYEPVNLKSLSDSGICDIVMLRSRAVLRLDLEIKAAKGHTDRARKTEYAPMVDH